MGEGVSPSKLYKYVVASVKPKSALRREEVGSVDADNYCYQIVSISKIEA